MKIVQLRFCLLLCCGAADGFSDLLVDLGQNVTLNCEISVKDVHWLLMKPSHPTVFILRSFSGMSTDAIYGDQAFRERFFLKHNGSLFIQNITVNELGIYYCMKPDSSQKISNGTRLYNTLHADNHSNLMKDLEGNQINDKLDDNLKNPTHLQILFIVSAMLNFILVIAVTGITVQYCKRTQKPQPQPPDSTARSSPQHQEASGAQYEEIELPSNNMRLIQVNSTYALLQKPKPQRGA